MQDFCFLIYTNEKYQPIADLTMGEFNRHFPDNQIKRYIVSNRFVDYQFSTTNATFLDCDINFDGMGNHFGQTMIKALEKIEEEYVIFFCDDYMLIDRPDVERLKKLADFIKTKNIDFISFSSMLPKPNWEIFDMKFEDLPERNFYLIPENYQYLYSVQPCIWKKSSLQEILKYNPTMSLHDLDTTNIKNREGIHRQMHYESATWLPYTQGSQNYGLKCVCTDFKGYDELFEFEFFIFPYIEIIRHGFFNFWQETNTKRFIEKFIEEKDIKNNQQLKKFIP